MKQMRELFLKMREKMKEGTDYLLPVRRPVNINRKMNMALAIARARDDRINMP